MYYAQTTTDGDAELETHSADGTQAPDRDVGLGDMLLEALGRWPERCAARFEGSELSRGELREEAVALAARLREEGLRPGMAVAIEIEHSLELVVAMCGAQIAGACVVPVDPAASAERRGAIFDDVCPAIVLRRREGNGDGPVAIERQDPPTGEHHERQAGLAFIVYTSGSSGGPKGVMITQESYVRRMRHVLPGITVGEGDLDLAWTPSSFIVMVDEIFLPLLAGMPMVVGGAGIRSDPRAFAEFVRHEGISVFRITPSLLDLVLRVGGEGALAGVKTIICSGEAVPHDLLGMWKERTTADLLGFYGATEAPAAAFHAFGRSDPPHDATAFVPQPFLTMRVVLPTGKDAASRQRGEVWIGGCAVASGYFRKPELTAEKFVERDGGRWYRTGDLGQWTESGEIEILGRADTSEININGARVSLPEVTGTLRSLPGVASAWVSAVQPPGRRALTLVGHYVGDGTLDRDAGALRQHLKRKLPSAAVPALLLPVDAMPLTENGKIDARRLAADALRHLAEGGSGSVGTAPEPASEKGHSEAPGGDGTSDALLSVVLDVANDLLETEGLHADDGFFASGGDSLSAVQYALSLGERLGMEVETNLIANTETFADVARAVASGRGHAPFSARIVRDGSPGRTALFTINASRQYGKLASRLETDGRVYNFNMFGLAREFEGRLDAYGLADLAGRFADEVLAADPAGPWRLAAFCQNACLAVETARALRARTGSTCSLLLIDAFFTEHLPTRKVQLMRLLDFGPTYYLRKLPRRFGRTQQNRRFDRLPVEEQACLLEKSKDLGVFYRRFQNLFIPYRPQRQDGAVTLFVSGEFRHTSRTSALRLAGQGLNVRDVGGLHRDLFEPDGGIEALAAAFDEELRELDRRGL